jgi:hypothetical protein
VFTRERVPDGRHRPNRCAAISGVTGVLGPEPIKFGLDCEEQSGGVRYIDAHLSYVEFSPGSP